MTVSNREIVDRFYAAVNAGDWDQIDKYTADDVIWEMPQSGERVRGRANNREMNLNYPGLPTATPKRVTGSEDKWVTTPSWTVLRVTGSGDEYVAETAMKYPDGSEWHAIDFFHFRGGKIARITAYFAPTLEPAAWRARWVERMTT